MIERGRRHGFHFRKERRDLGRSPLELVEGRLINPTTSLLEKDVILAPPRSSRLIKALLLSHDGLQEILALQKPLAEYDMSNELLCLSTPVISKFEIARSSPLPGTRWPTRHVSFVFLHCEAEKCSESW